MTRETYGPRTAAWRTLAEGANALERGSITQLFAADPQRFERFLDFAPRLRLLALVAGFAELLERGLERPLHRERRDRHRGRLAVREGRVSAELVRRHHVEELLMRHGRVSNGTVSHVALHEFFEPAVEVDLRRDCLGAERRQLVLRGRTREAPED